VSDALTQIDGIILRCEVGSGVHGIAVEGKDDRDEMAVCIEPPEAVCGIDKFEQFIYRSAEERLPGKWYRVTFDSGKEVQFGEKELTGTPMVGAHIGDHGEIVDYVVGQGDPRSEPGDLDLTVYSLRKWMRLAMNGNPSILLLLFAEPLDSVRLGDDLQELAPAIVSKRAGAKFVGYLEAQKQRLLRERGTARLPSRGDRDAKYASHMVRLGYQGVELLKTGRITLPMPENERNLCLEIKRGRADVNTALQLAGELAREIKDLVDEPGGVVRDEPDRDAINEFLINAYLTAWDDVLRTRRSPSRVPLPKGPSC
jgi:hypothetical protein